VGKAKKAGILGGAIVAIFLIGIVAYAELFYDDARLADLRATYFDDEDRLAVAVVLTNADGEFTKANGHLELTIKRGASTVYSNEYDFTKNDFLTWEGLFSGKTTGLLIDVRERFQRGDYDVYTNMETKSGRYWEGLHATFYSLEPRMVQEPIQQQIPEPVQRLVPEPVQQTQVIQSTSNPSSCSGNARCISGTVTQVIDGDTIRVDGQSIRFTLASTPEFNEFGGPEARNFIEEVCPVGSPALVDEDDGQTEGSYGRIVGVIYCNGINLNEAVLDANLGYLASGFCDKSEFSNTAWAQKHGCITTSQIEIPPQVILEPTQTKQSCDPSYPDFCIPPPPPDLDCKDIPSKKFTVLQPDPHRFDGDKDGIGCES